MLPLLSGCFSAGGEDEVGGDTGTETAGSETETGESESSTSMGSSESTSETTTESTTESTSETTDTTESTTGEPVCGDGMIEGDEVCDDGDANALAPGACAPNCSTIIATKKLTFGAFLEDTDFGPNPVAFADSTCPIGAKAMFVYGNQRVATTQPWESVGNVDWPVKPYTAYTDANDLLIWVTDDVALLAVRDGQQQMPINLLPVCTPLCLAGAMVSGLADDGTNLVAGTCNGWTTTNGMIQFNIGNLATLDPVTGSGACQVFQVVNFGRFLCIEQ